MIDTGAGYSAISEKEASLMNLNCENLPYYERDCFGFGGKFKNKLINRPVNLTFSVSYPEPTQYKITIGSGFQVVCIPKHLSPDEKEKIVRYTPCVIGMDILKQFKLVLDASRNKVELEV